MTTHNTREGIEEIGAFPNDPTGLRREFAIKFHRGDFYDAKKDKEWDNSEMISDWWLEQLHQELQKAREGVRDQEAKLWFDTWYRHYIIPIKPLNGEFAKFATERIQMTGYLRDQSELDPLTLSANK